MKVQSAKAKGRNLQKWTRERLIEELEIHEEDIESRSMGASGEDLIMARVLQGRNFLTQLNVKIKNESMSGSRTNKH